MNTKIIDINEFRFKRNLVKLNVELKKMQCQFEQAMKYGICDSCKSSDDTVREFSDNTYLCDGCVGV